MISDIGNFLISSWSAVLLCLSVGYFLGSLNFAIILTRLFKKQDIRTLGSGNAGFTNVLRCVGLFPGILTVVGDVGKGMLAVFLGRLIFFNIIHISGQSFYIIQFGAYIAGIAAILGHLFPCFWGFKGGKGVLTVFAMVLMLDWRCALILLAIFLLVVFIFRIVSLGSIVAAIFYPIITFIITFFVDYRAKSSYIGFKYVIVSVAISSFIGILILYKHKTNIKRLLKGEEKKITRAK